MIDIELIDYELPLVVVEKATVIPGGFLKKDGAYEDIVPYYHEL